MRRLRRGLGLHAMRAFGPQVLGALSRTWQLELLGGEHRAHVEAEFAGHFMSLWHGRMLLGLPYHSTSRNWHVLVSPSKDGDIAQRLLHGFGYGTIRGSSSRNGARAVRQVLEHLKGGGVLAVTPDGPRGPRHSMNPGLAWMARATRFPVLPCGFVCDRAWRLNRSWDKFTIPKRGARVVLTYGEPVYVERNANTQDMQRATDAIRQGMLEAERRGFAHLGLEPDWPSTETGESGQRDSTVSGGGLA